jgi:hypothetical protein
MKNFYTDENTLGQLAELIGQPLAKLECRDIGSFYPVVRNNKIIGFSCAEFGSCDIGEFNEAAQAYEVD